MFMNITITIQMDAANNRSNALLVVSCVLADHGDQRFPRVIAFFELTLCIY